MDEAQDQKTLDEYSFKCDNMPVNVRVVKKRDFFVPTYEVMIPGLAEGTKLVLNTQIRGELISEVKLDLSEIVDPKQANQVKKKFEEKAGRLLERHFPNIPESSKQVLTSYLLQYTLGIGELEAPLHDENLEEIVVNTSRDPVWVYHKKWGWCRTNVWLRNEESIYDCASTIGRRVGKQINVLNPLMDAHLTSGDRVNATLSPISTSGNTITIRKFSSNPWTIPILIEQKCLTPEVASLIWLCIQNEMSLLIAGGTGSGKTSFLNAIAAFFPPNQRIISIEDTREITLPEFLQWVPLSTREPNPEGKGQVTMLDLLVNSLRMRPDRMVVGEVRRQREAEILFEAMHTGHAVYATLHADNAEETVSRLTNPPINIPRQMVDALSGIVVQYRNRRQGIRRTFEFAEVKRGGEPNVLYRWDVRTDKLKEMNPMTTLAETLSMYSGITEKELNEDLVEKTKVLNWMIGQGIRSVNDTGRVVSYYYQKPEEIMKLVEQKKPMEV